MTTPISRRYQPIEVSVEDSGAARLAYEFYTGDADAVSNDPFDILADLEEDLGVPLRFA